MIRSTSTKHLAMDHVALEELNSSGSISSGYDRQAQLPVVAEDSDHLLAGSRSTSTKHTWFTAIVSQFPVLRGVRESSSTEEPKVLLENRWSLRLMRCLIHLAALSSTSLLLVLNLKQVYYSDANDQINIHLGALQFAAKVYDIIINASLGSFVLAIAHKAFCSMEGLSLGSLVSAYGFTQTQLILGPVFWSGLPITTRHMQHRPLLALIAAVGPVLLSISAGPIAAIALIPNFDTWPYRIDSSVSLDNATVNLYMKANEISPWPSKVDISALDFVNTSASDCAWGNGFGNRSTCPSAGLSQIKLFMSTQYDIVWDPYVMWNLTVTDFFAYKPRSLVSVRSYKDSAVASTQRVVLASDMGDIREDLSVTELDNIILRLGSSSASGGVPVPVVQVQCNQVVESASNSALHFPTNDLLMPPFHAWTSYPEDLVFTANSSQVGNLTLRQQSMNANMTYIAWVDLAQHNPQASIAPSIGAAIFMPVCSRYHDNWSGGVITCSVDARWIPSTILIDGSSSSVQDVAASPLELLLGLNAPQNDALALSPISISPEWAALLIPETHYADFYSEPELPDCDVLLVPQDMLASYIADGLSTVGLSNQSGRVSSSIRMSLSTNHDRDPESYAHPYKGFYDVGDGSYVLTDEEIAEMFSNGSLIAFNIETFRRGYGYGMKSWTDWLAAGVLLIHGLIALAAIVMIIFEKETTTAWGSFAELFMLALNSTPPEDLKNTGAGVSQMDTWRTGVAVRATRIGGDTEKVQIVCEGDRFAEDYTRPAVGKKYV